MPPLPLPTIPGAYYARISAVHDGLPTGNTFTFLTDIPPTSPSVDASYAQQIADSLPLAWSTTIRPLQPDVVQGYDSRVYPLGHPLLPAALGRTTGSGSGIGARAAVSAAAVIRHNVLRRGRGSQSHSSISPLLQSNIQTNGINLDEGFRTGLQTEFENMISAVISDFFAFTSGATISYVQLSKKLSTTFPITGSSVEAILGTERSRTPRP